jgi:hypothetical protein
MLRMWCVDLNVQVEWPLTLEALVNLSPDSPTEMSAKIEPTIFSHSDFPPFPKSLCGLTDDKLLQLQLLHRVLGGLLLFGHFDDVDGV